MMMMMWILSCWMALARGQTWTTQSPTLPPFSWVVLDHADGNSMGYGVTVAGDYVFTAGSMKQVVKIVNPQTGEEIESVNQGEDGDIFVSKVGVSEGSPAAVWTYGGSSSEFPSHLAASVDGDFISLTGYFSGNITFGEYHFTNEKESNERDSFVVKIAAEDGRVVWARHFSDSAGTRASGTAFDADGHVAFTMQRCSTEACVGVISLLDSEDGSTVWEHDFGPQVGSFGDIVYADSTFYAVGSLTGTADFGGDVGSLSSQSELFSDALLVALNSNDGSSTWAGLVTTSDPSSEDSVTSSSSLVEIGDGFVAVACGGACDVATSTASSETAQSSEDMGGAVVKFDTTTGAPLWIADVYSALGLAVAGGHVYVNTHASSTMSFGDITFASMGSLDQYIAKINGEDGSGEWVLSNGGNGMEYVRRMATDQNGDIYVVGLTQSNPSYFDPIVLTTHETEDGYDVFVAKLLVSSEALPPCKSDATTIDSDSCFVSNVCYESGDYSRVSNDKCKYCDTSMSQTSLDGLDSTNFCLIDGVCYEDGAYRQLAAGFGSVDSECEYCDVSKSTTEWTLVDGFSLSGDDATCSESAPVVECNHCGAGYNCNGNHQITCHENVNTDCVGWYAPYACPQGATCTETFSDIAQACVASGDLANCCEDEVTGMFETIAGYNSSTDVSTHAMIDIDAKEIEELSDDADWEAALFVYENGGNGLCSAEDIETTDESDSCFGKTTQDAKGNSIKGSGEIRTIEGFATSGREKMSEWPMWNLYRDYWNDDNYADTFIRNALSPSGAWSSRSDALRAELSAKGVQYQAVWMYVIHEMEDAVADCKAGDIFDNQDSNAAGDSPHAWDEAWAFYAGSLEGTDGLGRGYLLYDLAEKRCPQFGTCDAEGGAMANNKALAIANDGLAKILAADCEGVADELDKFVVQMTIPIIQGLVRYLYLADPYVNTGTCSNNFCPYDKEWAEAWAFAAAVLPQIDQCDSSVADLLVSNLDVDGPTTPLGDGYVFVKSQLESTYSCLGVTCADIGEYQNSEGTVYPGMEACDDSAPRFRQIAGYDSSTDVSTHAKIDLDAQEITDFSDAAEWDSALFVYENGGNGLCSAEDIETTDESDSCFGKTTQDAKGNSIKGSGDIRTIEGFATSGREKMSEWPMWNLYRDYWNDDNYADTFIRNALSPSGAWSSRSDALRAELSAKGAQYQAVWMYVIHEMEDAVADCKAGDIFDNQDSNAAGDSPHAWDEAWAFYAGSLEGTDGSGPGYLLYDLAEKRCIQFGTCGESSANSKALSIANRGLEKILQGDCDGVADELDKFVVQMNIPVIQGLVRYLYRGDPEVNGGSCSDGVCTYDKEWAEAWAFAAAVLPQIDQCDPAVAQLLVSQLDVDEDAPPLSDGYVSVKAQLESTYSCLGVTCADIGSYQDSDGNVYPGMGDCEDGGGGSGSKKKSSSFKDSAGFIAVIVVAIAIALCIVAAMVALCSRKSRDFKHVEGKPVVEDKEDKEQQNAMI